MRVGRCVLCVCVCVWIERKRGMGEMGERVRGENGEKKREVESGVESEM